MTLQLISEYANGYARYLRINEFGCGLLFDKANWQDPDSTMTPFWLNINDVGWKLTDRVMSWLDSKDDNSIAWKWQNKPCMALIPPINESFHDTCESLKQQIVDSVNSIQHERRKYG